MRGRYVVMSLMVMVFLTPIALWGQSDPGIRDTIRVGTGTINLTRPLPESLIIPVYAFTDDTISTFTIPIGWKSKRITLSNVIFDPVNVVGPTKYLSWKSYPNDNKAYLLGVDLEPGESPWGAWSPARHIADLIFRIDQNMPDTVITVDSTFVPPSFRLSLGVWPSGASFTPRFIAQPLSLIGPPAIDHVQPTQASLGDTLLVEITGRSTHFQQSSSSIGQAKLVHGTSQITAASAWVISAILIQAYFIIPTDAVLGLWDVVAGDGYNPVLTLTDGFRIHADPRLVSISPVRARQGENLWVTFTGRFTGFDQSGPMAFLCNGSDTIFAGPIAVASSTQLNAFFSIPKGSSVGLWNAGVRQNGYPDIVLNGAFALAGSPPEISLSILSLSDSLFSSETATHSLSVSNFGGDTLHFRARVTYDSDDELRKLAEQCVTGVALTEQRSAKGESLLTFSPEDLEKFKANLERYNSAVNKSLEYRNFKRIAIVGENNYDMIYRLMSDSTLVERYLFFLVNDYTDYSAIQSYDALVVAEYYASSVTLNEAEAIRRFYDHSKPVIMGLRYLQDASQNIRSALYPVFGISGASYSYSYDVYPNVSNPITDGVGSFYFSNFSSSFVLSGADWILRNIYGVYLAVSFEGKARTAFFSTSLSDLSYNGNPLLIANAINWMIYGKGWLKVSPDSSVVLPRASRTIDVTLNAADLFTGDYSADISFSSDDPVHSVVTVPVSLNVIGVPNLLVMADSISFGTVFVGGKTEDTAFIYNNGTGVLAISDISSNNTDFQTSVTSATVLPRDSVAIPLSFLPLASGATIGSLTITSNDPDHPTFVIKLTGSGQHPPQISVAPASLKDTLHTGETSSTIVTISNLGVADLTWKALIEVVDSTTVVSQSPSFSSPDRQSPDKALSDGLKQPDPGSLYVSPPLLARQVSSNQSQNDKSLEKTLLDLNQNYQSVTAIIPNRYDFSDGVSGYYIDDGGNDMYDGGNYLWTNLGSYIPYSDDLISLSSLLGTGGRYFTRKFPGLFVFVADLSGIQSFTISGSLGADGSGSVDGAVLQTHLAGLNFLGFVKRVYNAGDPSVNHLIIVEYDPSISHSFSTNTDNDWQQLSNLGGVTRIYDLLYASQSGGYVDNSVMLRIMDAFLRAVGVSPEWVDASPDSGVVVAGAQSDVLVHFNAAELAGADYLANLAISSNDPSAPQLQVPLTLTVIGAPDIRLSAGLLAFDTAFVGGSLSRTFVVYNDGTADLTIIGITSSSPEFAADRDTLTLAPGDSQIVRSTFAPQAVGVKVETLTLASNDPDQPQMLVSLSGIAVMPPRISVMPDSIADTLRTDESSKQVVTVTNSGAYRLDFSVDIRYHQELQALVSQCIKGISLTETTTADGHSVAALSPKDSVEFDSRLSGFYESISRTKNLRDLPVVAVVGDQANEVIFRLMSDSILAKDYLFYQVYNYSSYSLLKSYDGLIVAEYYYYWNIEKATAIRSFFDARKPVLLADNSFINYPDSVKKLLYPVFGVSSVANSRFTWGSLNAANPIAKGVTTVTMPYYYDYYCWFTLAKGDWIFSDQTGHHYGVSNDQAARSVLFGASFSQFWDSNNKQLLRNAINWMMRFGWITLSPWNSSVAPGSSVDIDVTLQARQMTEGDHTADVVFSSNDPADPSLTIPALLHVIGVPDIAISDSLVDFGTVFVGFAAVESLFVRNSGTAALSVTQVSATSPNFEISARSFTLVPGDSQLVVLSLTPTSSAILRDTLVIASNDPDHPSLRVPLLAKAVTPPVISSTPASFSDSLTTSDSVVKMLTLANNGGSNLKYDIQFQYPLAGSSSSSQVGFSQLQANAELNELGTVVESGDDQSASPPSGYTNSPGYQPNSSTSNGEIVKIAVVGDYSYDVHYWLTRDPYLTARYSFTSLGNNVSYASLSSYQGLIVAEYSSGLTASEATTIARFFDSQRPVLVGMYNFYAEPTDVKATLFPVLGVENAASGYYSWGSLNPHHPISSGINQVNQSFYSTSWFTLAGAKWIFADQDNRFYGVSFEGSARSVTIGANLYDFLYYGSNQKLMANAIDWMMGSLGWMSAQPDTGTIAPGHSRNVNLTLRGTMATPGDHIATVNVFSNDPAHSLITTPVYLDVTGMPEIACSDTLIEFPPTYVGGRAYDTVIVANLGTTTLNVTAIVTDSSEFSLDTLLFSVEPQAQHSLRVAFTPKAVGSTSGLLEFHSDDPDHPMLAVHLRGVGKLPPDIELYPLALNVTLGVDDTTTRIVSIVNQGTSDLTYQISVSPLYQSQPVFGHSVDESVFVPAQNKPLVPFGAATGSALGLQDAVIFHDDFEGNTTGWTHQSASGCDLWHVTTRDHNSGTHSWWCGIEQQGNYECAPFVDAALISPAISLVGWSGEIYLMFEESYNTEYYYDNCMVDVSTNGGVSWNTLRGRYGNSVYGNSYGWRTSYLNLSGFAGITINIRFRFDTGDENNNNYPGWFVDDVYIVATGITPISVTPPQGTVSPNDTSYIKAEFNGSLLPPGNYEAYIMVLSNDPDEQYVDIPVHLQIEAPFVCGDADGDGQISVADVVFLVSYIFQSGNPPNPLAACDADCSGSINIADVVYLINYIFSYGPEPCAGCK